MITQTGFGWIEIDGVRYNTDIIIYPDGTVEDRYRNFSGDNHLIEKREVLKVLLATPDIKPQIFVVGSGQMGIVKITDEAVQYLQEQGISLIVEPTPKAILSFNQAQKSKCAIFHVTC
ncbi:MAG: MTH938/NDUFAF3 family protein [candidate division WOR-3 bacterium]